MMIMLTKQSQRIQRCRKEIESSVQSTKKRETTAGEQRNQQTKGSNLAEGGDMLRGSKVIESAGNFRSTPYQMGDNQTEDNTNSCSETRRKL